jgi:hypothetical protein
MKALSTRCAVAVALVNLLPSAADAAMNPNTHLGQTAGHSVTLEVFAPGIFCSRAGPFNSLSFQRNLANGTDTAFPGPPAGQVLVVTDVDWQYNSGTPNSKQTLRLFLVNNTDPRLSFRALESTIQLNGSGAGGTSEAATSGFVQSSTATICVDEWPGGGNLEHLLLRGYLAPDLP